LLLALFLGCASGTLAGLIPGLHVNTLSIIMLSLIPFLSQYLNPISLGIFLVSMVITASFVDFIPSIFLGAPEASTALGVLPGHNLLLKGEGYKALKLTVIGGIGTFLFGLLFLPLLFMPFILFKSAYSNLTIVLPYLLLIFSALFILREKGLRKKFWAFLVFLLSGTLGLVALNNLNVKQPLFPMLSGLFGLSVLILSLFIQEKIVKQKLECSVRFRGNFSNYLKAVLSSALVSILPAIGAAQAAVIAQGFTKFKQSEDFLVVLGGINTGVAIFTLATLYLIGRARTGVMAALNQILVLDFNYFAILLCTAFTAAGLATFLTLKIGKFTAKNISRIKYRKLSLGIIILIICMVFAFSGWLGLLLLSIAGAIGLIAPLANVRRIHAMGCLVVPVVIYFL